MKARRLECCCCGADAGRWLQHWNRDTGYGVCPRCVVSEIERGVDAERLESLYGKPGVNYENPTDGQPL